MKAMKNMGMNRMLGSLKRSKDPNEETGDPQLDTPEVNAARNIRSFCESGGPNGSGEEVLYLPAIVEAAESSPGAAKECAYHIRKYLSKDNFSKPYIQYNAIMLIRILTDNPGKTFTRNMDVKFIQTVKELLRTGRDPSVKQLLMETLTTFTRDKADDETLAPLIEMWKKEQEKMVKLAGPAGPRTLIAPPFDPNSQNYFGRNHHTHRLPPPHELSSRIEEARTSAKLLSQVVQSTPPSELLANELIREFADRCQSASRSVQAYMIAENPSPDNDTMETLIETNEQLSKAMNQHQRAVLHARKVMGLGNGENTTPPSRTNSGFTPPPGPPPSQISKPTANSSKRPAPPIPPPGDIAPMDDEEDERDPFSDPEPSSSRRPPFPSDAPPRATGQFNDAHGVEPYHPGFKETKSYVGRQDSSIGNVTMHAAVSERDEEDEDVEPRYSVPVGKQPIYRY
ncbi:490c1a20-5fdf-4b64-aa01-cd81e045b2aa [Sclerotinia trifoliorum]|uniref:490c1a20-5fdf-4b64-aa01-cd81e045b2aa n=1 Tax=Sclerotinia trifoliorum TaxID=28548 RepID=A0A8H2ZNK3_9HELO|nr:490c1a20-5fdf-4b64-aa01-cd81e045b2aa [Sclerotinia trifoliorum]